MRCPASSRNRTCRTAQGSRRAPALPDSTRPGASPAGASSPPLRPRNSVRSAVHAVCRPSASANATRPAYGSFQKLRAKRAPVSSSSVTRNGAAAPRCGPEHPLRIGGHRQCPRLARPVFEIEAGDLDGIFARNEDQQVRPDSVMLVLEAAVPLAVTDEVRAFVPYRQRRRAPDLPGLLVPHEEGFPARVADRVVGPRRELVLAAVARTTRNPIRIPRRDSRNSSWPGH